MDLLQLLIALAIVGICAALAELVIGYNRGGFVVAIIAGVIGGYIGAGLASWFSFVLPMTVQVGTQQINLITTFLGSLLIVGALYGFERTTRWP